MLRKKKEREKEEKKEKGNNVFTIKSNSLSGIKLHRSIFYFFFLIKRTQLFSSTNPFPSLKCKNFQYRIIKGKCKAHSA